MAVDPLWGSVVGAAGSLIGPGIGRLFGGGGGPSPRDLAWESEKIRRSATVWDQNNAKQAGYHQARQLSQFASSAGIHPLAALGVPMAGTAMATPIGSSVSGSTMGDGLGAGIAAAAGGIGNAIGSRREAEREAAWRSMESGRLALEEQQARIDNLSASTAREAAEARKTMAEARSRSIISAVQRQPDARVLEWPSGRPMPAGPGSPHQELENEYGEVTNLESAYRYMRDRVFNQNRDDVGSWLYENTIANPPGRRFLNWLLGE